MVQYPNKAPAPGFYHHYKHDPAKGVRDYAYEVVGIGHHTEGEGHFVIYRPLYPAAPVYANGKMLDVRPLAMFTSNVPSGHDQTVVPRFRPVTDPAQIAELERARDEMYPPTS